MLCCLRRKGSLLIFSKPHPAPPCCPPGFMTPLWPHQGPASAGEAWDGPIRGPSGPLSGGALEDRFAPLGQGFERGHLQRGEEGRECCYGCYCPSSSFF